MVRSLASEGRNAPGLANALARIPQAPGNLDSFRRAAARDDVQSLLRRSPDPADFPQIRLELAFGLAWQARVLSTQNSEAALAAVEQAWEAVLQMPRDLGALVQPDLLGLIESARGNALRREERFAAAGRAFELAYAHLYNGSAYSALLADHLSLWASLLLDVGNLEGAEVALLAASAFSAGDPETRGSVHTKLGLAAMTSGEPAKALEHFLQALARPIEPGFERFLRLNLARAAAESGDVAIARRELERFTLEPQDSPFLRAQVRRVQGLTLAAMGEPPALDHLLAARAAFEQCGDAQGYALSTLEAACLALKTGDHARVAKLAAESLDVLTALGIPAQARLAWVTLHQAGQAHALELAVLETFRRGFPRLLLAGRGRIE